MVQGNWQEGEGRQRPNFWQLCERQNCSVDVCPSYHLRTMLSLNSALANVVFLFCALDAEACVSLLWFGLWRGN